MGDAFVAVANDYSALFYNPAGLARLVASTAFDLLGGVAHASAEAFETLNAHVSQPEPKVVEGILKGNARFLSEISHTMEQVAGRIRTPEPPAE